MWNKWWKHYVKFTSHFTANVAQILCRYAITHRKTTFKNCIHDLPFTVPCCHATPVNFIRTIWTKSNSSAQSLCHVTSRYGMKSDPHVWFTHIQYRPEKLYTYNFSTNYGTMCANKVCLVRFECDTHSIAKADKYVRLWGRTYIHTCRSYVHTPSDFTNGASLAWRLRWRISHVMFTCGWVWPVRWPIRSILGFLGSKVRKNRIFFALYAEQLLIRLEQRSIILCNFVANRRRTLISQFLFMRQNCSVRHGMSHLRYCRAIKFRDQIASVTSVLR